MTDPKRLLAGAGTDAERALLRAGRACAPPGAKQRALVASCAAAAASLTVGGAAAESGAAIAKAGSVVVLKWIGVIGATTVGIAGSAVALHGGGFHEIHAMMAKHAPWIARSQVASRTAKVAVPTVQTVGRAPPAASALLPALDSAAQPPVSGQPPVIPQLTPQRPVPLQRAVTASRGRQLSPGDEATANAGRYPSAHSTLRAELGVLDDGRRALAAGDSARALRILDGYGVRFPVGELEPEAIVLRIEAFRKLGDSEAARRTARAFLEQNPRSPYASRIESELSSPR